MSERRILAQSAASAAGAVTTAYTTYTVDGSNGGKYSTDVPRSARLEHAEFQVSAIAGGATKLSSWWSRDLAGDYPLTPVVETPIVLGKTTATDGAAVIQFGDTNHVYIQDGNSVAGKLYCHLAVDLGTLTLDYARLVMAQDT